MFALLFLASVTAAPPVDARLAQAAHAISAGRIIQARAMLVEAIAAGAQGDQLELLLADLAFSAGRSSEALARYELLIKRHPHLLRLQERALISALKLGEFAKATKLAIQATSSTGASWRAWNARGVAADFRREWAEADAAYGRATELAPRQAEILNNLGWSQLLRGNWAAAVAKFEQAAAINPAIQRLGNNLEFARSALSADLPKRQHDEPEEDWAARLNDAGVAAQFRGENARAVAAFSRALHIRQIWYERAANNLRIVEKGNVRVGDRWSVSSTLGSPRTSE